MIPTNSSHPPRNYDNRMRPLPEHHRTRLQIWLRSYRHRAHLTQGELADRAGISRKTIHAIETNKQWPTLIVALKISAALDTDVNKIFTLRESICCIRHIPIVIQNRNSRLR